MIDLADTLIHQPAPANGPKGSEHLRDRLRPRTSRFPGILYAVTAAGEPADLDTLTDQLLDKYAHRLPPDSLPSLRGGDSALVAIADRSGVKRRTAGR
jgi:hypothetical protein